MPQPPLLAGPAQVLDYPARYTHRIAVSNERIEAVDAGGVRLRVRDTERGGTRTVRIDGVEFTSGASWLMGCRAASSGCGTMVCWRRGTRPSN